MQTEKNGEPGRGYWLVGHKKHDQHLEIPEEHRLLPVNNFDFLCKIPGCHAAEYLIHSQKYASDNGNS